MSVLVLLVFKNYILFPSQVLNFHAEYSCNDSPAQKRALPVKSKKGCVKK